MAGALAEPPGALGVDRLDAQLLLAHLLQRPRTWLLAHDEHALDADQAAVPGAAAARARRRRAAGLPDRHADFRGLTLGVGPGVLVPRPETELLVDWALELLAAAARTSARGTSTSAPAAAPSPWRWRRPARARMSRRSTAAPQALAIARANGRRLGLEVDWRAGDWWQPLAG